MPSADYQPAAILGGNAAATTRCAKPLVYSGTLDKYEHADVTPVIGREYRGLQVVDLLRGDDQMFRDLAATSKWFHRVGGRDCADCRAAAAAAVQFPREASSSSGTRT